MSQRKPRSIVRRELLLTGAGLSVVAAACGKQQPFACTDVSGLNVQQLTIREKLSYRDRAVKPELVCDLCTQYVAPTSGEGCGSCKVMPGPAHPKGSCKVFARKT